MIKEKLSKAWGISVDDVKDVLEALDAYAWADGGKLDIITHAGFVDEGRNNKFFGHDGYWISDGNYIALVNNGEAVWGRVDDENVCLESGLRFGEDNMLESFKI